MLFANIAPYMKKKMGRITSSGAFIANIDGLRFFAVASVVIFHIEQKLGKAGISSDSMVSEAISLFCRCGWFGVELFFTISGFVLALPFARSYLSQKSAVPKFGQYYLRRVTRIEPPYIISLFVFFLLRILLNHEDGHELFPHLIASLLYMHNAWFQAPSLVNAVSWSLEVEVQFYLLAPLLSQVFRLKSRVYRYIVFWALPILINLPLLGSNVLSFYRPWGVFHGNLFSYLQYFMVGFIVADLFVSNWQEKPIKNCWWDFIGIFSSVLILLILLTQQNSVVFAIPLLVMGTMIASFRGILCSKITNSIWLATIGGMCYTIYLYHNIACDVAMHILVKVLPGQHYLMYLLMSLFTVVPLLLMASAVMFVACEKPFMHRDWPQKMAAYFRRRVHMRKMS